MWKWLRWILLGILVLAAVLYFGSKRYNNYTEDSVPKFIQANFVDPNLVVQISKFRSGAGHSNAGWPETCRSMKHYVTVFDSSKSVNRNFDRSQTPPADYAVSVLSPVDGRLTKSATGEGDDQLNISVSGHSGFSIRFEHVHLLPTVGKFESKVTAGEPIATVWNNQNFDVSVYYHYYRGDELFSYFEVLPDNLYAPWADQGLNKSDVIISKAWRDAHPLTCDNSSKYTPYFIDANGQRAENWNADNIINLKAFAVYQQDLSTGQPGAAQ